MAKTEVLTININSEDVESFIGIKSIEFRIYVPTLLNQINAWSKATNKEHVGHLNELMIRYGKQGYKDWRKCYLRSHKSRIENSTDLVYQKLKKVKQALNSIDHATIKQYIEDLVLVKTYRGFKIQQLIFKRIKVEYGAQFKRASTRDESRGIDGYINTKPVSVKPVSYRRQAKLHDTDDVPIVFYKFKAKCLEVDLSNIKGILKKKKSL